MGKWLWLAASSTQLPLVQWLCQGHDPRDTGAGASSMQAGGGGVLGREKVQLKEASHLVSLDSRVLTSSVATT